MDDLKPWLDEVMFWEDDFSDFDFPGVNEDDLPTLQAIIYEMTEANWTMFKVIARSKRPLTRVQVVQALGRSRVVPYDIRMLNHLVDVKLIKVRRRHRPLKNGYPTGYELVYHVPASVHRSLEAMRYRRKHPRKTEAELNAKAVALAAEYAALEAELEAQLEAANKKPSGLLAGLRWRLGL